MGKGEYRTVHASTSADTRKKVIMYFVTEDWYFCSHRLPLAIAARHAGYDVHVLTRVADHGQEIEAAGLNLIPIDMARESRNPFSELKAVARISGIYKRFEPDIVHHVALKPVIYGSIAAWLARIPSVVNALAGLGRLFSSSSRGVRMLRPVVKTLFRLLLNNERTTLILQNPDDVETLCSSGVVDRKRVVLIRGSGVDVCEYRNRPEPDGPPVVLLASRMLWDKGVGEFVEAAQALRKGYPSVRFVLAGIGDDSNPASIPDAQLEQWNSHGDIEWVGKCDDMPTLFARCHFVCLPTYYGEGIPKVLIEAASCGRPIVATDAPGCREIVRHGENGLLVPIRNVSALADAIRTLLDDPQLRSRMGAAGREIARKEFTIEAVTKSTLELYETMLQRGGQ